MSIAAKKIGPSPASLGVLRLLLFLVVTLFLPETRVWAFTTVAPTVPGKIAPVSASSARENASAIAYDAPDCSVAEAATGPVSAGEFTTYQGFVDRSVVGDGLEGHELWQHANMNEMGLTSTRLSTPASEMNPVIVLDRATHQAVNAAQAAFDARAMTPVQNINLNAQIMMDLKAAPPSVIDAARRAALEHAGNYGY